MVYKKILDLIIDDLKTLYEGYQMEREGTRFDIFGRVLLCTGDILCQHLWRALKERVGFAFQKCRDFHFNFNEIQQSFNENEFNIRTKHAYERHCLDIANDQAKANLKRTCEIKTKSPFCALSTFDVIKQRMLRTLY